MTKKYAIALPDGEGIPANKSFWKTFFDIIGIELKDVTDDLDILTQKSNQFFPTSVCTNSKVRLGKSVLLEKEVTHFLFFLRKDKYVNNCPASVYRIRWIKEKFPHVQTIVWPYDLDKDASFKDNLLNLAQKIIHLTPEIKRKILELEVPQRKAIYNFPCNNNQLKVLLIGVAPHSLDPYRKTKTMDYLVENFDIYSPLNFFSEDLNLEERGIDDIIYFKEKAIFYAIDKALEIGINNFFLVADPLDLPGNFTFPIIKEYLMKKGVKKFNSVSNEKNYLELISSYKNGQLICNQLDKFKGVIHG